MTYQKPPHTNQGKFGQISQRTEFLSVCAQGGLCLLLNSCAAPAHWLRRESEEKEETKKTNVENLDAVQRLLRNNDSNNTVINSGLVTNPKYSPAWAAVMKINPTPATPYKTLGFLLCEVSAFLICTQEEPFYEHT